MAKETDSQQDQTELGVQAPQEVNIDEIEVSVLMLVKNARAHQTAATFLIKRGWPTKVVQRLKDAIEVITKEKPDFVLLSVDFPHPAIGRMATLFGQTLNTEVILFSETMDSGSVARLGKMNGQKLSGSPSGPNLQRSLRKILQDKLNPQSTPTSSDWDHEKKSTGDQTVTIKGDGSSADNGYEFRQNQTISSEGQGQHKETLDTGSYKLESQDLNRRKLSLKDLKAQGAMGGIKAQEKEVDNSDLMSLLNQMSSNESEARSDANESKNLIRNDKFSPQANQRQEEGKKSQTEYNHKDSKEGQTAKEEASLKGRPSAIGQSDSKKEERKSLGESSKSRRNIDEEINSNTALSKQETEAKEKIQNIHKAVLDAIEELCQAIYTSWTGAEPTSHLHALSISHEQLNGYLILKLEAKDQLSKNDFLKKLTETLNRHIAKATQAKVHRQIEVEYAKFNFRSWMDRASSFRVSSELEGIPFCVGFIQTVKALPKISHSEDKRMVKVLIEDLPENLPVNFKGYIHLKRNKKYLLYLKNGRQILPEQKRRLKNRNVNDLSIKKIEEENIKKFFVQSQISESIFKSEAIEAA